MQRLILSPRLHRLLMLFFSLAVFRPHVLLARTFSPLTRITLEATSAGPPTTGSPGASDPAAATDAERALSTTECLSIGEPSRGRLMNGVQLVSDALFSVRGDENWGTAETVEAVRAAVTTVAEKFPGTPRLVVGDLSKKNGGRIWPHRSHQSGRDIDLGYYHLGGVGSNVFVPADSKNLDLERTWALIEALVALDEVQYIFIDRRVQRLVREYARTVKKVPEATLRGVFEFPGRNSLSAVVRHCRGHRNHLHVRFFSPVAVAAGERLGTEALASLSPVFDPWQRVRMAHRIRRGETLAKIAHRYKVDLVDLMKWNNLRRRTLLQTGQVVTFYRRVKNKVAQAPVESPPSQSVCHAGPRGAIGCWHPSRS